MKYRRRREKLKLKLKVKKAVVVVRVDWIGPASGYYGLSQETNAIKNQQGEA
jgi:hypothetical protein